jgi:polyhydroxyalkanoate synthase
MTLTSENPILDSEAVTITIPRIPTQKLTSLQNAYAEELEALFSRFTSNQDSSTLQAPLADKRFQHTTWQSNALYHLNAALYLLQARYLEAMVDAVELEHQTKQRIRLAISQWIAAWSPANFLSTNPEAQNILFETKGASLQMGVCNLLSDMVKGRISQTDEQAFVLGKNLACTAGAVVFENELFQLLQYSPLTDEVHVRPLLIVPPCINKYYILDLQPENSLVRYAVKQGHRVFIISWRNPDASLQTATWDDYIELGVIQALKVVSSICNQEKANLLGFCIGGTMASTALAVLAERAQDRVASLTLLTTFLDFADTGMLGSLIDEQRVRYYEKKLAGMHEGEYGLMKGVDLANTFSFLRPDDLIWHYVVAHYLKGQAPKAFDLLYWNSDSTNLPGPMYAWYLRHFYIENRLKQPDGLQICGTSIDLRKVRVPTFIYGSRDDHIVPWQAAYASMHLLGGPCRFVLGASGHIAGVVNPPTQQKRAYWVNLDLPASPTDWFDMAKQSRVIGWLTMQAVSMPLSKF